MKTILLLFFPVILFAQGNADKPAYTIYNASGKVVKFGRMMQTLKSADVVLFGEYHNNPISHWMEFETAVGLWKNHGEKLMLGAEMFETDQQTVLDEFLNPGDQNPDSILKKTRMWPNFDTDYRPLTEWARDNKVSYVATNVPRKFASQVSKQGRESLLALSDADKAYMCPLPYEIDFELPGYKQMRDMFGSHGHGGSMDNMIAAQALKDATMAHFIHRNRQKGTPFLHLNGSYHSDHFEGIVWYLKRLDPNLKIMTITTREYPDPLKLKEEDRKAADFIIAVPETMTKTY